MTFPYGCGSGTSKAFQDHNLWLLDQRLTYAKYVASDFKLKEHRLLFEVPSSDEPDIVCYYNLGFSEDDPAEGELRTVVIVELKRPGPIGKRKENPWQQVMRYIGKVLEKALGEKAGKKLGPLRVRAFIAYPMRTGSRNGENHA